MQLDRFAAGTITDICLQDENASQQVVAQILHEFIAKQGSMMTVAIGTTEKYQEIYEAGPESLRDARAGRLQTPCPVCRCQCTHRRLANPFHYAAFRSYAQLHQKTR